MNTYCEGKRNIFLVTFLVVIQTRQSSYIFCVQKQKYVHNNLFILFIYWLLLINVYGP